MNDGVRILQLEVTKHTSKYLSRTDIIHSTHGYNPVGQTTVRWIDSLWILRQCSIVRSGM